MTQTIDTQLATMSSAHVLEAAMMALPPLLGIDDLEDGPARVAELAQLPLSELAQLSAISKQACENSDEVVSLIRAVLASASDSEAISDEAMHDALDAAGHKQMVIGPDIYYLGVLLIAAYVAMRNRGVTGRSEKITIEEMKDGRKKITIDKKETILNPLSPLITLIEHLLKKH